MKAMRECGGSPWGVHGTNTGDGPRATCVLLGSSSLRVVGVLAGLMCHCACVRCGEARCH